ncbi:MAG TPA: glycosyltransferase family 4 protein [Anaerolineae bacterium]|nr:glycosyltransferase family 4 protein [Anaerolineae bacterium]
MKALVVIFEELVPISGGGTPRTFSIVRSLVERGHEVHVAASFGLDEAEARSQLGATGVLSLAGVSRMDPAKMRKYAVTYPLNILRVATYAWRLGPDVILTHNTAAGFAALLGKLLRPKSVTVLDLTDLLFEYLDDYKGGWLRLAAAGGRWMERTSVRHSDRIITISGAMREILVHDYGAQPGRVDIIHDGVDTEIFRRQEAADLRASHAPNADHVLIFHGVIDPQDGPELLVEAAPAILAQHPKTRFWMVGDGTAVPDLKARAEAAGLLERFFFSGWVQQSDVARYISASDLGLVILPDVLSARGRVTLKEFEYWACGVPAVLPRLPALQEVVGDELASLFYTPGDAVDFAEKVNNLLTDEDRRREMGRLGQRRVAEQFEWRALTGEIAHLCEEYVGSRSAHGVGREPRAKA